MMCQADERDPGEASSEPAVPLQSGAEPSPFMPADPYLRVAMAFNESAVAQEFLSEDGDGGIPAGVYRMAEYIASLRSENDRLRKALEQDRDELASLRLLRDSFGDIAQLGMFRSEILSMQRAAGFSRPDLRHEACATCGAEGMNTGWGYWKFACGREILTCGDGDSTAPCKTQGTPSEERSDEALPAALNKPDTKYREEDSDDGLIV